MRRTCCLLSDPRIPWRTFRSPPSRMNAFSSKKEQMAVWRKTPPCLSVLRIWCSGCVVLALGISRSWQLSLFPHPLCPALGCQSFPGAQQSLLREEDWRGSPGLEGQSSVAEGPFRGELCVQGRRRHRKWLCCHSAGGVATFGKPAFLPPLSVLYDFLLVPPFPPPRVTWAESVCSSDDGQPS